MAEPRARPPSIQQVEMTLKSLDSRERGNDLFKLACLPGLAPAIQVSRLERALKDYVLARNYAAFNKQLCSASKNVGSAHWRLALLSAPVAPVALGPTPPPTKTTTRTGNLGRFLNHAAAAEINLTRAEAEGTLAYKGPEWTQGVRDQLETVITVTKDMLVATDGSLFANEDELAVFHHALRTLEDACHIKAFVYFLVGVATFKNGVAAYEIGSSYHYAPCLSAMNACRPLLLEAARLASKKDDEDLSERSCNQMDEVDMQQSVCESRQAVAEGDRLLRRQLEDEEQPDMEMIWVIVDMYRQGVLLARENCLESEALAQSRLGVVFLKVFKVRSTAKKCFNLTMDLADSLHPKDMSERDWHIAAARGQKNIERAEKMDEAARSAERDKLKGEIQDLLDPIDAIMANGVDNVTKIRNLLKHIYQEHVPKLPAHRMTSLKPEGLRRTLMKAILHYHSDTQQRHRVKESAEGAAPDNQAVIDWGTVGSFEKWEVLCGEISRHLNFLYTHTYKGD